MLNCVPEDWKHLFYLYETLLVHFSDGYKLYDVIWFSITALVLLLQTQKKLKPSKIPNISSQTAYRPNKPIISREHLVPQH